MLSWKSSIVPCDRASTITDDHHLVWSEAFVTSLTKMATDALRAQVATKWQESFTRLNQNEPGIVGLLNFSQARAVNLFLSNIWPSSRHGILLGNASDREDWMNLIHWLNMVWAFADESSSYSFIIRQIHFPSIVWALEQMSAPSHSPRNLSWCMQSMLQHEL